MFDEKECLSVGDDNLCGICFGEKFFPRLENMGYEILKKNVRSITVPYRGKN